MRWPWSRRRSLRARLRASDGEQLADAQRRLDEARAVEPAVRSLARELAAIRERNRLAPMIMAALREHR
jgi:hypothetical protein